MNEYSDKYEERWVRDETPMSPIARLERAAFDSKHPLPPTPLTEKQKAKAHTLLSEMMAHVSTEINKSIQS